MRVPSGNSISRVFPTPALSRYVRLQDTIHLRGVDSFARREICALGNEDWEIAGVGGADAVRAFHERGVEGDEVHEHAKAELFPQKFGRDLQFRKLQLRVEEQLDRIIAGLAMDVDGAGEIGRERVIEPVVVSEPGILFGEGDEV